MTHMPTQPRVRHMLLWALALTMGTSLASPVAAQTLTEADFRATIVGTKLTGMLGAHLIFQADGTIVGGMVGDESTRGTWSFNGASLCTIVQDEGGPAVSNCGVPELTKRRLVVGGEKGLRLQHNQ